METAPRTLPEPDAPASARPFRLLHLEDCEPDHALALAYLQRAGLRPRVIG